MSSTILEQTIFGIYEILADVIPGMLLLLVFIIIFDIQFPENFSEAFVSVLIILLAFTIGQLIHSIASKLGYYIIKSRLGGYPSSKMLESNDTTFPDYYKDKIREKVNTEFSTPIDSSSQHIFEICYTFISQNKLSNRESVFLNMFSFSRSMIFTSLLSGFLLYVWAINEKNFTKSLLSLAILCSSILFYERTINYSKSFASEVFKNYFVYKKPPEKQDS